MKTIQTKTHYYAVTRHKLFRRLLQSRTAALGVHWTFQSMLHMDGTELAFKIGLDLVLAVLFSFCLAFWLPAWAAILAGFLLAHTLNFLFNGQIFVVLKSFGDVVHELDEYTRYIQGMKTRLQAEPAIRWAAIYGSMARGELKETSDLDIRLIRNPGFWNGLRACWFVLLERTRAHWRRFPIDFLVLDSTRLLKNLRADEPPLVIFDEVFERGSQVEAETPADKLESGNEPK